MLKGENDRTILSAADSLDSAQQRFDRAHGELRIALINAIARRVGRSLQSISTQEASSDISELYHRKLNISPLAVMVQRLLSWWH